MALELEADAQAKLNAAEDARGGGSSGCRWKRGSLGERSAGSGSAGSNVLVGGVLAIAGSDGGSGPCMWSSGIVG